MDTVILDVQASVGGEIHYAAGSGKGFFRDADISYIPPKPRVAISVTNVGRRAIVVSKIYGKYKMGEIGRTMFVFNSRYLPKALQPYETVMEVMDDNNFIRDLQDDLVENLYAQDTKGYSWRLSKAAFERLKKTAKVLPEIKRV